MPLEYYEPIDFVERITHAEQVSFVFGSALTGMRDGIGILEPKEIVAFIKAKMISAGFQDAFLEHMHKFKSENEYQIAFEFLVKKFGIDGVNKIIREIVKLNEDPITGKQKIPENVKLFAKAVKDKKINLKYIITTNFDTLIEEAFTNEGIQFNSLSIVSNSNINDNSNGLITIVHIHGVWDRGDTMHTRNQLDRKRGKIEESLKNIVQDGQLCVMAYGAWEDSFTRTLTSLLDNNISTYSLIWCFYPDISGQIDRDYVNVFSLLDDAISRERVQFYKGIDCREIFGKIDREVLSRKKP